MGWVKTVGYILIATAILAAVLGLGLAIVAAVFVGGLIVSAVGMVIYLAATLREYFER